MDCLQTEQQGAIAWIWLNRPLRLNALDQHLITALQETFLELAENTSVRVIILAGRGRAFCAGFDIEWMAERTPEMVRADRASLREVYAIIEQCPLPLISAVHGDAMGGGLILTMVSDIVLASDDARFGVPEIKIGIFPSLELIPRLERLVGLRMAKKMALLGEPINARDAYQYGLVTELTTQAKLYEDASRLAEQIASLPALTASKIKESFNTHRNADFITWETETAVACWSQAERHEAMQAFLSKRKNPSK